MRKYSLLLAVMLAASFATVADAAKKKAAAPADAAYEWNVKNMPPQPMPGAAATPAKPAKAAKKAKKASKKKAKKS